jgi:vitamin B12 transporter
VGNSSLRPETSRSAELGIRTDVGTRVSSDVAIFQQNIRDLIEFVYAPLDTTENIGRSRIEGIEASLTLRPTENSDVVISETHLDPRDLTNDVLLVRRPRNKISVLGHWTWEKFTLSPELDYTGASYDYLYDDNGNYLGTGFGKSGLIADLAANYRLNPHVTLTATGRNITGTRFEAANGYQVAGASFLAGVKMGF